MNILKDLHELTRAEVITPETAESIRNYYKNKSGTATSRLFIVFGILGAVLVGLGMILIVAHNWDELSRGTKTFLAFFPLLVGQLLCGYVLIKKNDSTGWRESASSFLFFSIGAILALISQIYNIPGETDSFLLTWMLLSLPLIYVMKSSTTSLFYLCGITYYAAHLGYWSYPSSDSYLYWLLLLGILPHYYLLYWKKPHGNFMFSHNWIIPLSVVVSLGTLAKETGELMFISYFSLFGLFLIIGNLDFFKTQKLRNNGYKILGSLGTMVLLLTLSFDWFWLELREENFQFLSLIVTPEFFSSAIITLLAGWFLYLEVKNIRDISLLSGVFILFIPTFIWGVFLPFAVVLINVYVLAIGISKIRKGAKQDHLGILNYGLLIITALIICRFFDTDISFVMRGMMFLILGGGFFVTNFWMLKKRKSDG